MIIFLITINSYFEINYKLENNKNNLEYRITTFHEIPKNSEYILSTSNYHIFHLENKTLLIPNSDIISIQKTSNIKPINGKKVYKFLKSIYEKQNISRFNMKYDELLFCNGLSLNLFNKLNGIRDKDKLYLLSFDEFMQKFYTNDRIKLKLNGLSHVNYRKQSV